MSTAPGSMTEAIFWTIKEFVTGVDVSKYEEFVERLIRFGGTLHVCATGPTAHLARKVSQTLTSVNVKSAFLHPVDALHGDLGNVFEGDIVLLITNIDSAELLVLISALRLKRCHITAMVSRSATRVSALSDSTLYIDVPTRCIEQSALSTLEQLLTSKFDICVFLILETLIVRMMHLSGLTKTEYGKNHPSGKIGRHLRLRVSDVLIPLENVPTIREDEVGIRVLVELSSRSKGCGCILVVDDEMRLQGTMSDADFRRALLRLGEKSMAMKVNVLMNYNKSFPRTCRRTDLAIDALNTMSAAPAVSYLPVLSDDGCVTGLVTLKSLQDAGI